MQFLYHPLSSKEVLNIDGEYYNYLFRVRRHKIEDVIALRNMSDGYIYFYKISEIRRKEAVLVLVNKEYKEILPKKFFHLLWCVVEPKVIEKTLPMLNEIGVGKISFVYCDRSQKNFKLKIDKLKKILINSCQQCGRSRLMDIEICKNIDEVIKKYDNITLIDFSDKPLKSLDIKRALIGPEGGFSAKERESFKEIVGFDTKLILKSESAAVAVASKIIL